MKFNRKNPKHYIIFFVFSINFLFVYFFKLLQTQKIETIALLGHQFQGNLEGFFNEAKSKNIDVCYFTFDYKESKTSKDIRYILNPFNINKLLNCNKIVASHGIFFHKLINYKKIKTYNIGHGVQTSISNYAKSNYILFDEIWLATNIDKNTLIYDCNYLGNNLEVTGFIKIENIFKNENKKQQLKSKYNLNDRYCLYAPTATGNLKNNLVDNFQYKNKNFLKELNKIAYRTNFKIIIKLHYNDYVYNKIDKDIYDYIKKSNNLIYFQDLKLENNDHILNIADVLITDWSSIYLEFLCLDKPILFLNSPRRRGNIELSKIIVNESIYRIKQLSELEQSLEKIKNNEEYLLKDLKNLIFENKYHKNVFDRYYLRLNRYE